MNSSLKVLLIIALSLSLYGCTQSSAPVTSNGYAGQGEYSFAVNGTSFQSKSGLLGGSCFATLYSYPGLGGNPTKYLSLTLISQQDFHSRTLSIEAPVQAGVQQSLAISTLSDTATKAAGSYFSDTLEYDSNPGGTFTITKFDTVANLISGTFNFTATDSKQTANPQVVSITSGTFTNVPIYGGSFGQGSIQADADGFSFTANGSNAFTNVSAFIERGTAGLSIIALDDDTNTVRGLEMLVITPKPGVFNFDSVSFFGSKSWATYSVQSDTTPNQNVSIGSSSGHGSLTITKFDSSSHRMSGTFNFSGQDPTTGRLVQVSNGVIDNVEWFVL